MFAAAVLKESFEDVLEVAFLLCDETLLDTYYAAEPQLGSALGRSLYDPDVKTTYQLARGLEILPLVGAYVDRLRGHGAASTTDEDRHNSSSEMKASPVDDFFDDPPNSLLQQEEGEEASCLRLFDAADWHRDPHLTRGDKQALDLLSYIVEVTANSTKALILTHDLYLDILLTMIERGAVLLHQGAAYYLSGRSEMMTALLNPRQARICVYQASAALKIVYYNLQLRTHMRKKAGDLPRNCLNVLSYGPGLIRQQDLLPIDRRPPISRSPGMSPKTTGKVARLESSPDQASSAERLTYRERIVQAVDILVANPLLHPDRSYVGSGAVLFAGLHDVLRPKAAEQFSVICGLLEKSDADIDTPCERALVIRLMGGLEGPRLVELISPAAGGEGARDVDEGDVEKFIRSILLLADRSLAGRLKRLVDRHYHDTIDSTKATSQSAGGSSDIGEGILRVLEPTTIQTFCNLCHRAQQAIDRGDESSRSHALGKLIDLASHLISSAQCTIAQFVSVFERFEAQAVGSSNDESGKALEDVSESIDQMYLRFDEAMHRSHVAHLIPLVLFGISLLWRTAIAKGQRSEMEALVGMFVPLRDFASSLSALERLEERFRAAVVRRGEQAKVAAKEPGPLPGVESPSSIAAAARWDPSLSNNNLEYSDNGLSCRRPGSASCYPAAFAPVPANKCTFTVKLAEAQTTTNWLTIGICTSGFASSSSDGFGRSSNSW